LLGYQILSISRKRNSYTSVDISKGTTKNFKGQGIRIILFLQGKSFTENLDNILSSFINPAIGCSLINLFVKVVL